MKRIGELADFPHLLEHLMSVDPVDSVQPTNGSGINTACKKPEGRFDLVVESADPRIGIFAACFAANIMNNFIAGNPVEDDSHILLEVVDMITTFPETKEEIVKLAVALGESVENINSAINQLAHFHYFDNGTEGL